MNAAEVGAPEEGAPLDQSADSSQVKHEEASPAAPIVRQNMVENAVSFLTHPSVQNSSIGKRIAFLEHKGLNNAEIKVAMKRAGVTADTYSSADSTGPVGAGLSSSAPLVPRRPQPQPRRTWGSLLLTGMVFAGVGAGLALLGSRVKERYFDDAPKPVEASPSAAAATEHGLSMSSPAEWEESVSELKSELRQLKALYLDNLSASRNMPLLPQVVGGTRQTDIPAESHIPAWQKSGLNRSQRFAEERKARLQEEKKSEEEKVEVVEEEEGALRVDEVVDEEEGGLVVDEVVEEETAVAIEKEDVVDVLHDEEEPASDGVQDEESSAEEVQAEGKGVAEGTADAGGMSGTEVSEEDDDEETVESADDAADESSEGSGESD